MSKVLIHSNYAPTNYGGIEQVVLQLIKINVDRGFEVACFFGGDSNGVDCISNLVTHIKRKIHFKKNGACLLSLGNIKFILHAIKARFVIFQEPYPSLWPALLFLQWFTRTEIIILVHADPEASLTIKHLYSMLRRIILTKAHVVTTSPQLMSKIGLVNCKSSNVIPLGIPEHNLQRDTRLGEKSYVLYFGRLADYKGLDYLLESIKALPHIPFVIAGQGPLSSVIAEFINRNSLSNVRFINEYITDQRKFDLIRNCYFLVFPSTTQNEAFGIVQLEAMRECKPIVNTLLNNGVNFVAPDGLCAISCPPRDSLALTKSINLLWTDNSLHTSLSAAARSRFEEKFTEGTFVASWLKLIGDIVR